MSWQIDNSHSHIQFSARHMMLSTVRGEFQAFNGSIDFDPNNLTNTSVAIEIDTDSISTRSADRDNHLKSPDFLSVADFPKMTFKSRRVEQRDADSGKLIGDLTIRNVTKEVALDVDYAGTVKSPRGQEVAGFSANTTINRKDWGLSWNAPLETGGLLVGEKIKIAIDLELVNVPDA